MKGKILLLAACLLTAATTHAYNPNDFDAEVNALVMIFFSGILLLLHLLWRRLVTKRHLAAKVLVILAGVTDIAFSIAGISTWLSDYRTGWDSAELTLMFITIIVLLFVSGKGLLLFYNIWRNS